MEEDRICGANAVAALFDRRPGDVLRLFYAAEQRPAAGPYCAWLAGQRRPYRMLDPAALAKAAGTQHHGGLCAVARPRALHFLDGADPPRHRLILALDGIGNPHNLGAIARSAAFFGVPALLLHETADAALPSDAAYRVAEGGLEWLALYRTKDLARAVRTLDPHYRSVAATPAADAALLRDLPRDRPVLLVLGHEERGVSPAVLAACRRRVRLSGSGRVESLNVAQSAAVLLHGLIQT